MSKVLKLIKKQISCENNVWITAGLLIDQIPITTVEFENEISELKDQLFEIIHILGTISNMMSIITVFGQNHFLKRAKMLSFLKYVELNSTYFFKLSLELKSTLIVTNKMLLCGQLLQTFHSLNRHLESELKENCSDHTPMKLLVSISSHDTLVVLVNVDQVQKICRSMAQKVYENLFVDHDHENEEYGEPLLE